MPTSPHGCYCSCQSHDGSHYVRAHAHSAERQHFRAHSPVYLTRNRHRHRYHYDCDCSPHHTLRVVVAVAVVVAAAAAAAEDVGGAIDSTCIPSMETASQTDAENSVGGDDDAASPLESTTLGGSMVTNQDVRCRYHPERKNTY